MIQVNDKKLNLQSDEIQQVFFNGVDLEKVYCNGVLVFEKKHGKSSFLRAFTIYKSQGGWSLEIIPLKK